MASNFLKKLFGDTSTKENKKITPLVEKIESLEAEYKALSDAELQVQFNAVFPQCIEVCIANIRQKNK